MDRQLFEQAKKIAYQEFLLNHQCEKILEVTQTLNDSFLKDDERYFNDLIEHFQDGVLQRKNKVGERLNSEFKDL